MNDDYLKQMIFYLLFIKMDFPNIVFFPKFSNRVARYISQKEKRKLWEFHTKTTSSHISHKHLSDWVSIMEEK